MAGLAAVASMLLWSDVCMAQMKQVPNPSFESTYYVTGQRWLPSEWTRVDPSRRWNLDHPSFSSYCTSTYWKSEGTLSLAVFSRSGKSVAKGDYQSYLTKGMVDLTGIAAIEFDVRLAASPPTAGSFEHFEASLLVDEVPLWTQNAGGVYLNQQVNVSKLAGMHFVELRIAAVDSGLFNLSYWTQWDNLRLVEGPTAIEAFVDLDPNTLNLGSNGKWITGYIELPADYDAALIDGATVTLEGVPAHMGAEGWATPQANDGNLSDRDADGMNERMVKFDRAAVEEIVQPPEATLVVKGTLTDGTPFEGAATIRVIDEGGKKK